MQIWSTTEMILTTFLGILLGFAIHFVLSMSQLQKINAQVSQSVKQQQISNTNDMCFEYINAKIQKDLHNK